MSKPEDIAPIIAVAIIGIALLYVSVKFVTVIIGFIIDHRWLVLTIAVIASGITVLYFVRQGGQRKGEQRKKHSTGK